MNFNKLIEARKKERHLDLDHSNLAGGFSFYGNPHFARGVDVSYHPFSKSYNQSISNTNEYSTSTNKSTKAEFINETLTVGAALATGGASAALEQGAKIAISKGLEAAGRNLAK